MSVIRPVFKLASFCLAFWAGPVLAQAPERVVSVNLCTDQMAMLLAEPSQLISISYLSLDPLVSTMSEEAKHFAINHGQLEEIVALRPDMVLAHQWTSPILLGQLDRLNIKYQVFETPQSLQDVPKFIQAMGQTLGVEENANVMIDEYSKRLSDLPKIKARSDEPIAVFYGPNGWVGGTQNLAAQSLELAGFENLASHYGYDYGGKLPIELLVASSPDAIFVSSFYDGNSQAENLLGHPALYGLSGNVHELTFDKAWSCGLPQSLDGLWELEAIRAELST